MMRLLKSFIVVGIIFGFIATGTVYADLSVWDGKWFDVTVKRVSVCYDNWSSKFVEDNENNKNIFMKFWWDSHPGVDFYMFDEGKWVCTPATSFAKIGGNDWEFLFHISIDQRPSFFHMSTQRMHSKLINGNLQSAFFLPLGVYFFSRDDDCNCAGQQSLSGKLINYVPVPLDDIMENGCRQP